jgi:hypothetical protein
MATNPTLHHRVLGQFAEASRPAPVVTCVTPESQVRARHGEEACEVRPGCTQLFGRLDVSGDVNAAFERSEVGPQIDEEASLGCGEVSVAVLPDGPLPVVGRSSVELVGDAIDSERGDGAQAGKAREASNEGAALHLFPPIVRTNDTCRQVVGRRLARAANSGSLKNLQRNIEHLCDSGQPGARGAFPGLPTGHVMPSVRRAARNVVELLGESLLTPALFRPEMSDQRTYAPARAHVTSMPRKWPTEAHKVAQAPAPPCAPPSRPSWGHAAISLFRPPRVRAEP